MKINRTYRMISSICLLSILFNVLSPLVTAVEVYALAPDPHKKVATSPKTTPIMPAGGDVNRNYKACPGSWCAGGGGFCAEEGMLAQGMGCNAQAKALFDDDPCYVTGTCPTCASGGCSKGQYCTAEGYCTWPNHENTKTVVDEKTGETSSVCLNRDGTECVGNYQGVRQNDDGTFSVEVKEGEWIDYDPTKPNSEAGRTIEKLEGAKGELFGLLKESFDDQAEQNRLANKAIEDCVDDKGSSRCRDSIEASGQTRDYIFSAVDDQVKVTELVGKAVDVCARGASDPKCEELIRSAGNYGDYVFSASQKIYKDNKVINSALTQYQDCRVKGQSETVCRATSGATKLTEAQLSSFNQNISTVNENVSQYKVDEVLRICSGSDRLGCSYAKRRLTTKEREGFNLKLEDQEKISGMVKLCLDNGTGSEACKYANQIMPIEVTKPANEIIKTQVKVNGLFNAYLASDQEVISYFNANRGNDQLCKNASECRVDLLSSLKILDPQTAKRAIEVDKVRPLAEAVTIGDIEAVKEYCFGNMQMMSDRVCPQGRGETTGQYFKRMTEYMVEKEKFDVLGQSGVELVSTSVDYYSNMLEATVDQSFERMVESIDICGSKGAEYNAGADVCVAIDLSGQVQVVDYLGELPTPVADRMRGGSKSCSGGNFVYDRGSDSCVVKDANKLLAGTYWGVGALKKDNCNEGFRPSMGALSFGGACVPVTGNEVEGNGWYKDLVANTKIWNEVDNKALIEFDLPTAVSGVVQGVNEWSWKRNTESCMDLSEDSRRFVEYCNNPKMEERLALHEGKNFYGEGVDELVEKYSYIQTVDLLVKSGELTGSLDDYIDDGLKSEIKSNELALIKKQAEYIQENLVTNTGYGGTIKAEDYVNNPELVGLAMQADGKEVDIAGGLNPYVTNQVYVDGEWIDTGKAFARQFWETYQKDKAIDRVTGERMTEPDAVTLALNEPLFYIMRAWDKALAPNSSTKQYNEITGSGQNSMTTILKESGVEIDWVNGKAEDLEGIERVIFDEAARGVYGDLQAKTDNPALNALVAGQNAAAFGIGWVMNAAELANPVAGVALRVAVETVFNFATQKAVDYFIESPRERMIDGLETAAQDIANREIKNDLQIAAVAADQANKKIENREMVMGLVGDLALGGMGETFGAVMKNRALLKGMTNEVSQVLARDMVVEGVEALGKSTDEIADLVKTGRLYAVTDTGDMLKLTRDMNINNFSRFVEVNDDVLRTAGEIVKGSSPPIGMSRISRAARTDKQMVEGIAESLKSGVGGEAAAEVFLKSKAVDEIINPVNFRTKLAAGLNKINDGIFGKVQEPTVKVIPISEAGGVGVVVKQGDVVVASGKRVVLGEGEGQFVRVVEESSDGSYHIVFSGKVDEISSLTLKNGQQMQFSATAKNWRGADEYLSAGTVAQKIDGVSAFNSVKTVIRTDVPQGRPGIFSQISGSIFRVKPLENLDARALMIDGRRIDYASVEEMSKILRDNNIQEGSLVRMVEGNKEITKVFEGVPTGGEPQFRKAGFIERQTRALSEDSAVRRLFYGDNLKGKDLGTIVSDLDSSQKTVVVELLDGDGKVVRSLSVSPDDINGSVNQIVDQVEDATNRVEGIRYFNAQGQERKLFRDADGLYSEETGLKRLVTGVFKEAPVKTGNFVKSIPDRASEALNVQRFGKLADSSQDVVLVPGKTSSFRVGGKTYTIDDKTKYIRFFDKNGKILYAVENQTYASIPVEYLAEGNYIQLVKSEGASFASAKKAGEVVSSFKTLEGTTEIGKGGTVRVSQGRNFSQWFDEVIVSWFRKPDLDKQFSSLYSHVDQAKKNGAGALKVVDDNLAANRAANRVSWLGGKIPSNETAYRLAIPDGASKELTGDVNELNAMLDRFEASFGHHVRPKQLETLVAPESILQLNAGEGKTSVIGPMIAAMDRRTVVTLKSTSEANDYVGDILAHQKFFEDEGIEIVFYDNNRGEFLEVSQRFNRNFAKVIEASEVEEMAQAAAKNPRKYGLMIVTESSDNAWGLIKGSAEDSDLASKVLHRVLLGDGYGAGGYTLAVDEIGAVVDGSFSVSRGTPKEIAKLVGVEDTTTLMGLESGKDVVRISLEARDPEVYKALDGFRKNIHEALETTGDASKHFYSVVDESTGVRVYKLWPKDDAVVSQSLADILEASSKRSSGDGVESELLTKVDELASRLRNEPNNMALIDEVEKLIKEGGDGGGLDSKLMAELTYRKADLQARWFQMSRVPGNDFGQEGAEMVLRKTGGTTGEVYSTAAQRMAIQSEGADMLEAAGKRVDPAIHRSEGLFVDRAKLTEPGKLTLTPDSDQLSNVSIYEQVMRNGKLKGYDATPTTAANKLGTTATDISERPPRPVRMTTGEGPEDLVRQATADPVYRAQVQGKAKAVVFADEGVSYGKYTDAWVKNHPETDTLIRAKYVTDRQGGGQTEYFVEKIVRAEDGSFKRVLGKNISNQGEWNRAVQDALKEDPNKLLIVYEGRTRAIDLKVTDQNKNIRWSVIAGDQTNMETVTQSVKRNRVLAQMEELRKAGWTEAEIKAATEYSLMVRTDKVGLNADNVVDNLFKPILDEQLANTRLTMALESLSKSNADGLKAAKNDLLPRLKGQQRRDTEKLLDSWIGEAERVKQARAMEMQRNPLKADEIPTEVFNRGKEAHVRLKTQLDELQRSLELTDDQVVGIRKSWGVDQDFLEFNQFESVYKAEAVGIPRSKDMVGPNKTVLDWAETNDERVAPKLAFSQKTDPETTLRPKVARELAEGVEEGVEAGRVAKVRNYVQTRGEVWRSEALQDAVFSLAGVSVWGLSQTGVTSGEAVATNLRVTEINREELARELFKQVGVAGGRLEADQSLQISKADPVVVTVTKGPSIQVSQESAGIEKLDELLAGARGTRRPSFEIGDGQMVRGSIGQLNEGNLQKLADQMAVQGAVDQVVNLTVKDAEGNEVEVKFEYQVPEIEINQADGIEFGKLELFRKGIAYEWKSLFSKKQPVSQTAKVEVADEEVEVRAEKSDSQVDEYLSEVGNRESWEKLARESLSVEVSGGEKINDTVRNAIEVDLTEAQKVARKEEIDKLVREATYPVLIERYSDVLGRLFNLLGQKISSGIPYAVYSSTAMKLFNLEAQKEGGGENYLMPSDIDMKTSHKGIKEMYKYFEGLKGTTVDGLEIIQAVVRNNDRKDIEIVQDGSGGLTFKDSDGKIKNDEEIGNVQLVYFVNGVELDIWTGIGDGKDIGLTSKADTTTGIVFNKDTRLLSLDYKDVNGNEVTGNENIKTFTSDAVKWTYTKLIVPMETAIENQKILEYLQTQGSLKKVIESDKYQYADGKLNLERLASDAREGIINGLTQAQREAIEGIVAENKNRAGVFKDFIETEAERAEVELKADNSVNEFVNQPDRITKFKEVVKSDIQGNRAGTVNSITGRVVSLVSSEELDQLVVESGKGIAQVKDLVQEEVEAVVEEALVEQAQEIIDSPENQAEWQQIAEDILKADRRKTKVATEAVVEAINKKLAGVQRGMPEVEGKVLGVAAHIVSITVEEIKTETETGTITEDVETSDVSWFSRLRSFFSQVFKNVVTWFKDIPAKARDVFTKPELIEEEDIFEPQTGEANETISQPAGASKVVKIGRQVEENGDIVAIPYADLAVSREHAELLIDATGNILGIRDIGSSYGTYVNTWKITENNQEFTLLREGDKVKLGEYGSYIVKADNNGIIYLASIYDKRSFIADPKVVLDLAKKIKLEEVKQGMIETRRDNQSLIDEDIFIPKNEEELAIFTREFERLDDCTAGMCNGGVRNNYVKRSERMFSKSSLSKLTENEKYILVGRTLAVKDIIGFDELKGLYQDLELKIEELNEMAQEVDENFRSLTIDRVYPELAGTETMMGRSAESSSALGLNFAVDDIVMSAEKIQRMSRLGRLSVAVHEVVHSFQGTFGEGRLGSETYNVYHPYATYCEVFTEWITHRILNNRYTQDSLNIAYYTGATRLDDYVKKHFNNEQDTKEFYKVGLSLDFNRLNDWLISRGHPTIDVILGKTSDYHYYNQMGDYSSQLKPVEWIKVFFNKIKSNSEKAAAGFFIPGFKSGLSQVSNQAVPIVAPYFLGLIGSIGTIMPVASWSQLIQNSWLGIKTYGEVGRQRIRDYLTTGNIWQRIKGIGQNKEEIMDVQDGQVESWRGPVTSRMQGVAEVDDQSCGLQDCENFVSQLLSRLNEVDKLSGDEEKVKKLWDVLIWMEDHMMENQVIYSTGKLITEVQMASLFGVGGEALESYLLDAIIKVDDYISRTSGAPKERYLDLKKELVKFGYRFGLLNIEEYEFDLGEKHNLDRFIEHVMGIEVVEGEEYLLVNRMEEDHYIIKEKYGLPPRDMRFDEPYEYLRRLEQTAKQHKVPIRDGMEFQKFFEETGAGAVYMDELGVVVVPREDFNSYEGIIKYLGSLEHELIHALQHQYYPGMPVERREYEAYIGANVPLSNLRNKPIQVIRSIFSGFAIQGSVKFWYEENNLPMVWLEENNVKQIEATPEELEEVGVDIDRSFSSVSFGGGFLPVQAIVQLAHKISLAVGDMIWDVGRPFRRFSFYLSRLIDESGDYSFPIFSILDGSESDLPLFEQAFEEQEAERLKDEKIERIEEKINQFKSEVDDSGDIGYKKTLVVGSKFASSQDVDTLLAGYYYLVNKGNLITRKDVLDYFANYPFLSEALTQLGFSEEEQKELYEDQGIMRAQLKEFDRLVKKYVESEEINQLMERLDGLRFLDFIPEENKVEYDRLSKELIEKQTNHVNDINFQWLVALDNYESLLLSVRLKILESEYYNHGCKLALKNPYTELATAYQAQQKKYFNKLLNYLLTEEMDEDIRFILIKEFTNSINIRRYSQKPVGVDSLENRGFWGESVKDSNLYVKNLLAEVPIEIFMEILASGAIFENDRDFSPLLNGFPDELWLNLYDHFDQRTAIQQYLDYISRLDVVKANYIYVIFGQEFESLSLDFLNVASIEEVSKYMARIIYNKGLPYEEAEVLWQKLEKANLITESLINEVMNLTHHGEMGSFDSNDFMTEKGKKIFFILGQGFSKILDYPEKVRNNFYRNIDNSYGNSKGYIFRYLADKESIQILKEYLQVYPESFFERASVDIWQKVWGEDLIGLTQESEKVVNEFSKILTNENKAEEVTGVIDNIEDKERKKSLLSQLILNNPEVVFSNTTALTWEFLLNEPQETIEFLRLISSQFSNMENQALIEVIINGLKEFGLLDYEKLNNHLILPDGKLDEELLKILAVSIRSQGEIEQILNSAPSDRFEQMRTIVFDNIIENKTKFEEESKLGIFESTKQLLLDQLSNADLSEASLIKQLTKLMYLLDFQQAKNLLLELSRDQLTELDLGEKSSNLRHFMRIMDTLARMNTHRGNELVYQVASDERLPCGYSWYLFRTLIKNGFLAKDIETWFGSNRDNTLEQVDVDKAKINGIKAVSRAGIVPSGEILTALVDEVWENEDGRVITDISDRLAKIQASQKEFDKIETADELRTILVEDKQKAMDFYILEKPKTRFDLVNNYTFSQFTEILELISQLQIHQEPIDKFSQALSEAGFSKAKIKSIITNLSNGHQPFYSSKSPFLEREIRLDVSNITQYNLATQEVAAVMGKDQLGVVLKSSFYREYLEQEDLLEAESFLELLGQATTLPDRANAISLIEADFPGYHSRLVDDLEESWQILSNKMLLPFSVRDVFENDQNAMDVEGLIAQAEQKRVEMKSAKKALIQALKNENPERQALIKEIGKKRKAVIGLQKGLTNNPGLQAQINQIQSEISELDQKIELVGQQPITLRTADLSVEEKNELVIATNQELEALVEKDTSIIFTYLLMEIIGEERLVENDVDVIKEMASHLEGPMQLIADLSKLDGKGMATQKEQKVLVKLLDKKTNLMSMVRFADSKICCFSSSNYTVQVAHNTPNKYWLASINKDPLSFVFELLEVETNNNIGFVFGSFGIDEEGLPVVLLNGVYLSTGNDEQSVINILDAIEEMFSAPLKNKFQLIASNYGGAITGPGGYSDEGLAVERLRALDDGRGNPETKIYDDLGTGINTLVVYGKRDGLRGVVYHKDINKGLNGLLSVSFPGFPQLARWLGPKLEQWFPWMTKYQEVNLFEVIRDGVSRLFSSEITDIQISVGEDSANQAYRAILTNWDNILADIGEGLLTSETIIETAIKMNPALENQIDRGPPGTRESLKGMIDERMAEDRRVKLSLRERLILGRVFVRDFFRFNLKLVNREYKDVWTEEYIDSFELVQLGGGPYEIDGEIVSKGRMITDFVPNNLGETLAIYVVKTNKGYSIIKIQDSVRSRVEEEYELLNKGRQLPGGRLLAEPLSYSQNFGPVHMIATRLIINSISLDKYLEQGGVIPDALMRRSLKDWQKLKDNGFVHGDFADRNILVVLDGTKPIDLRIIDPKITNLKPRNEEVKDFLAMLIPKIERGAGTGDKERVEINEEVVLVLKPGDVIFQKIRDESFNTIPFDIPESKYTGIEVDGRVYRVGKGGTAITLSPDSQVRLGFIDLSTGEFQGLLLFSDPYSLGKEEIEYITGDQLIFGQLKGTRLSIVTRIADRLKMFGEKVRQWGLIISIKSLFGEGEVAWVRNRLSYDDQRLRVEIERIKEGRKSRNAFVPWEYVKFWWGANRVLGENLAKMTDKGQGVTKQTENFFKENNLTSSLSKLYWWVAYNFWGVRPEPGSLFNLWIRTKDDTSEITMGEQKGEGWINYGERVWQYADTFHSLGPRNDFPDWPIVNELNQKKQSGNQVQILDLFSPRGQFIPELKGANLIDEGLSVGLDSGTRKENQTEQDFVNGDLLDFWGPESPWRGISSWLETKSKQTFDMIVCRPVGGFGLISNSYNNALYFLMLQKAWQLLDASDGVLYSQLPYKMDKESKEWIEQLQQVPGITVEVRYQSPWYMAFSPNHEKYGVVRITKHANAPKTLPKLQLTTTQQNAKNEEKGEVDLTSVIFPEDTQQLDQRSLSNEKRLEQVIERTGWGKMPSATELNEAYGYQAPSVDTEVVNLGIEWTEELRQEVVRVGTSLSFEEREKGFEKVKINDGYEIRVEIDNHPMYSGKVFRMGVYGFNNELVASLTYEEPYTGQPFWKSYHRYVAAKYRGQGIGSQLQAIFEEILKTYGEQKGEKQGIVFEIAQTVTVPWLLANGYYPSSDKDWDRLERLLSVDKDSFWVLDGEPIGDAPDRPGFVFLKSEVVEEAKPWNKEIDDRTAEEIREELFKDQHFSWVEQDAVSYRMRFEKSFEVGGENVELGGGLASSLIVGMQTLISSPILALAPDLPWIRNMIVMPIVEYLKTWRLAGGSLGELLGSGKLDSSQLGRVSSGRGKASWEETQEKINKVTDPESRKRFWARSVGPKQGQVGKQVEAEEVNEIEEQVGGEEIKKEHSVCWRESCILSSFEGEDECSSDADCKIKASPVPSPVPEEMDESRGSLINRFSVWAESNPKIFWRFVGSLIITDLGMVVSSFLVYKAVKNEDPEREIDVVDSSELETDQLPEDVIDVGQAKPTQQASVERSLLERNIENLDNLEDDWEYDFAWVQEAEISTRAFDKAREIEAEYGVVIGYSDDLSSDDISLSMVEDIENVLRLLPNNIKGKIFNENGLPYRFLILDNKGGASGWTYSGGGSGLVGLFMDGSSTTSYYQNQDIREGANQAVMIHEMLHGYSLNQDSMVESDEFCNNIFIESCSMISAFREASSIDGVYFDDSGKESSWVEKDSMGEDDFLLYNQYETSRVEGFAISGAAYVLAPEELKREQPTVYRFYKDYIFNGTEYTEKESVIGEHYIEVLDN